MSYLQSLGAIPSSEWCSSRNPQSACRGGPNMCSPRIPRTLEIFRRVQEGVNKLAPVRKFPAIAVDGDIGPETIAGVNKALRRSYTRCEEIAQRADAIASELTSAANKAGVGALPDTTDPLPREIDPNDPGSVDLARKEMQLEPTRSSFLGAFMSPVGLAALGAGALLVWGLGRRRKGGKPSSLGWF